MVFPVNGLRGMLSGQSTAQLGLSPSGTAEPLWRSTQITPLQDLSDYQQIIDKADLYDMVLSVNFAGARGTWCDPGPPTTASPGGTLIYNKSLYQAKVAKFAGIPAIASAITRRRFINFTVDEPNIAVFNGSIPKSEQNNMGLFHKSIWPDALTFQRTPASLMTPPPAGGWTGIDYGGSQYNLQAFNSGLTPRQWYDSERSGLLAVGCGMVPMNNWLDGGDGRLWDYLNTGTSSGRVVGTSGSPRWMESPAEIREKADAIFDDADAIGFQGYTYCDSGFESGFLPYQVRSDFVAAWNYALNKMASRPVFNGYRTAKGTATPPVGVGADIEHFASTPITTRTSTISATYVDVPGAIIPAANLTPGKRYFIQAVAAADLSSTTAEGYLRLVSGTTVLARSEQAFTVNLTAAKLPYFHWGVITAVSGEDIKLQFKSSDGIATVGVNFVQLFDMNISDDLTDGTDFKFAESTASTALTTSYQDGASITFTPVNSGDDWLVLTGAHFQSPSLTQSIVSGLRRGGAATETDPEVQEEGEDARDLYKLHTAKVLSLPNSSNTFAEQSKTTGGGGPRDGSAVIAFRLNRFAAHSFAYDNTVLAVTNTPNYGTTLETTTFTTAANGDIWVLGSFGWLGNFTTCNARLTMDGADEPAGQTSALTRFTQGFDATDVSPVILSTVYSQLGGSHVFNFDASSSASGAQTAQGRLIVAVGLALSAPVGATKFRHSNNGIGTRAGSRGTA